MEKSEKMMEKPAWGRQQRRDLPIWEKQIARRTQVARDKRAALRALFPYRLVVIAPYLTLTAVIGYNNYHHSSVVWGNTLDVRDQSSKNFFSFDDMLPFLALESSARCNFGLASLLW